MTSIRTEEITCAICGSSQEYAVIASTNAFGSPDLDLRPSEMERSTMPMWIQQCAECGYCAPDVSQQIPDAADIVASNDYKRLQADKRYPALARQFLLFSLLNEGSDRRVASRARLHAAWVCEDAGHNDLAVECRLKAIEDITGALPFPDTEEGITEGVVCVDMLRRVGNFGQSVAMIDTLLTYAEAQDVIKTVLEFERELCAAEDAKCYTVDDASHDV